MANRLASAKSPYLLQHAENPVDWYEWGPEALERARREDKPILLSVGYSACHWCHVMAHESFEDAATATIQNERYVSIKVDREERPDLDQVYQLAAQVLGRQGGWPLTMFLTPALEPFYGGTYFPPTDRYGMPGFKRVLQDVAAAYQGRRTEVEHHAKELVRALEAVAAIEERARGPIDPSLIEEAASDLLGRYDESHGGFGSRPKFPNTMNLDLLLRASRRGGDPGAVFHTLEQMARGGIYDQLGGGFARYSTDERWLVPHFEKMLYDNALIPRVYLAAWQASADPEQKRLFERIARETFAWVRREMTHARGGLYSTLDADSEGEEGKFYVWDEDEIAALIGKREAEAGDSGSSISPALVFCRAYGVVPGGNFEHTGKSVLSVAHDAQTVAQLEKAGVDEVLRILAEGRLELFQAREKRVRPFRDEKIITAWNGLMISAFCDGAKILRDPADLASARAAADFLRAELWRGGRLLRVWKEGAGAGGSGYLDDYAFLAAGLLDLFEAGGRAEDFEWAEELARVAVAQFSSEDGGFFLTAADSEALIQRPRSAYDQMIPSGAGVLAGVLLRLHALTGHEPYFTSAEKALTLVAGAARQNPFGFGQTLCAADLYLEGATVAVLAGDAREVEPLDRAAHGVYQPNKVVLSWPPGAAAPRGLTDLLAGKSSRGVAYLCSRGTCSAPIDAPALLARALAQPPK